MKIHFRTNRPGFTLIELMAVIVIIVILAGMVVGGLGYVNEKQARSKAQVQIALISKALEEYKLEMGKYPGSVDDTPAAGTVSEEIYNALFFEGWEYGDNPARIDANPPIKATRIFLAELDPISTKQGWVTSSTEAKPKARQKILDPWGKEFYYRKGRNANNPDFDLWSAGKDGRTNPSNPSLTTPATNNPNRDDVRNF